MNLILRPGFLITICFLPLNFGFSQSVESNRDTYSILTEPYNERPLNLHRGQLQANLGYMLAIRTRSYDAGGARISLSEDGRASVIHTFPLDIRYGILEFLEVGARINYSKQGIREQTRTYISGGDYININELNEYKGFSDLEIWGGMRLPIQYNIFDFAIRGGVSFPTANHRPDKPSHTIEPLEDQSYSIQYHYNHKNGNGVMQYLVSALFKLRLNRFSIIGNGIFYIPSGEGESIQWNERLENNQFVYEEVPYTYYLSRSLDFNGEIHFQALGWLDIFLGGQYFSNNGGWTEQYGDQYALPERRLVYIQPGLEIQVSPLIRLNQEIGFPVSGKNTDAPFFINISLSFNMMPFAM